MDDNPKRLCVVVARYGISGVPLAQIRLATSLAARGHEVDLIIGFVPKGFEVPIVKNVNLILWDRPRVRGMARPLVLYLSARQPEAIFSAEDHLNLVVILGALLSRSKVKISASSRVTPYDTYSDRFFSKGWLFKQLMRMVMVRADVLTCVSKDMVDQYRSVFRSARHVCVYNIVDTPGERLRMREDVEHPWFEDRSIPVCVAAGQLAPWKGFQYLIQAVAILVERRPIRLILLGDGPQRAQLEALVDKLDLVDRVCFEGAVANPLKYFVHADVFVLSSLVEGMPSVLVEAMMAGCTPVSTDCPTGPKELIRSGHNGYLVPTRDSEALAVGIEEALAAPIPAAVLADAVAPFREDVVIERHLFALGL